MCPAGTAFAQPSALASQRLSGLLPQDPFPLRDLLSSSSGALFKTQDLVRQALFSSKCASSELAPLLPLLAEDACSRKPYASGVLTPYPSSQPAPKVPHVRQAFNWDCGLACVLMVLQAAAPKAAGMDLATLRQYCPTTSIWTIDLAHLLRRFGMEVVFCTITLGANPAFSSEAFYAENMPEDEARVQQLFNDAPLAGIPVHQRSLDGGEVKEAMGSGRYLAIALVDKIKLGLGGYCGAVGAAAALWGGPDAAAAYLHTSGEPAYVGHYIVVVAYCASSDSYEVRDPAAEAGHLTVPAAVLEAARRSFGTDEDIILVGTPAPNSGFAPPGVDFQRAARLAASF
jgi:hypothetical protein